MQTTSLRMSATNTLSCLCLLLLALTTCRSYESDRASSSYFNPLAPSNAIGVIGETVEIPCPLRERLRGNNQLIWTRNDGLEMLATGYIVPDEYRRRYSVRYYGFETTWYIEINQATKEDEGTYVCQLSGTPQASRAVTLTMIEKSDNLRWRPDSQCGVPFFLSGALSSTPAECDPDGMYPCCSNANWCGFSELHCNCHNCIDYRTIRTTEPSVEPDSSSGCPQPFTKLLDKCVLFSPVHLPWKEAAQFCMYRNAHLITFSSLDQLIQVVGYLTKLQIPENSELDVENSFWVNLSTEGRSASDGVGLEWRWVLEEPSFHGSSWELSTDVGDRCGYLHSSARASIRHTDDCSALLLPLCELTQH